MREIVAAYERFTALLREAEACRDLFLQARLPIPPPLQQLLSPRDEQDPGIQISPMVPPVPRPANVGSDWIWVDASDCTVGTLVLAALASEDAAVPVQRVVELVTFLKRRDATSPVDVNSGSVANVGTRFEREGIIERGRDGWVLSRGGGPVAAGKVIFGLPKSLEKQEVASYRREVIMHILKAMPDGLQNMQIVKLMDEGCSWLHPDIPRGKDLVKMDMQALIEVDKVRRSGNSGKYVLAA